MPYEDLREFIRALEKAGELKRISIEVSPILEISEIADRVSKSGGPALLFENVKGSKLPVLINAFGSPRRMELALGIQSLDEIPARIREYLTMKPPDGLLGKIKMLPLLAEVGSFFPKQVGDGPAREVDGPDRGPGIPDAVHEAVRAPLVQRVELDVIAGRLDNLSSTDVERGVIDSGPVGRIRPPEHKVTGLEV